MLPPAAASVAPVRAVLYTRFEDVEGYVVTASDPPNVMKDQFKDIGYHFLPDKGICWRLISLVLGDYRMIGVPVHIEDSRVLLAKSAAQALAESFHALEDSCQFLSNDEQPLEEFLQSFRKSLNDKSSNVVNVHLTGNAFVQFFKATNFFTTKTPNIDPYHTPIALTSCKDPLVAEILELCNGSNSVSEISSLLEVDFDELAALLKSLVKHEMAVVVDQPIDTYTRVRLTPKFHTFFDDLNNRQEAVDFCQISGPVELDGNYLVRLYCRIDGHVSDLGEFKITDNSPALNVRNLVLFGLLKGFLRCKVMYPVYSDYVTTMVPLLRLCDGTNSWDHIGSQFQLTRLEMSEIFNHHGVLKIWK